MVDVPNGTTTTRNLPVGGSVSNVIDVVGDQDWFEVFLVAGVTYDIALNGSCAAPLADPFVRLLSADGTQITWDDDSGDGLNSLLTTTVATTGRYYISAEAYAFGTFTGEYTLALGERDIAPDATTTATLVADGFVRG